MIGGYDPSGLVRHVVPSSRMVEAVEYGIMGLALRDDGYAPHRVIAEGTPRVGAWRTKKIEIAGMSLDDLEPFIVTWLGIGNECLMPSDDPFSATTLHHSVRGRHQFRFPTCQMGQRFVMKIQSIRDDPGLYFRGVISLRGSMIR